MSIDIFVFGSNLAGIHGAGAAKFALDNHGAVYGQGIGLQGRSYAIPTKDHNIITLPLNIIQEHVDEFIKFARQHPNLTFNVTRIGCGLAGYKPSQIAPMFANASDLKNVILDPEFKTIIRDCYITGKHNPECDHCGCYIRYDKEYPECPNEDCPEKTQNDECKQCP